MRDTGSGRTARTAAALARACHLPPTLAVTAFGGVLAVAAGTGPARAGLVAAAVLFGQLSIGWSNDRLDAGRDRAVGRADKPVARGEIGTAAVDTAIALALLGTAALSALLGWRAGLVQLALVGCGWAYNLGAKATVWSWLPYAGAFGALPAVATLARADHAAPAGWVVAAGALLGVTGHLANVLPDLADDAATDVRGLPHRLGAHGSLALATALLLGASALIVLGPPGPVPALGWAGGAVDVVAALGGLAHAWRHPTGRSAFYGIIVVVAVNVGLLLAIGGGLR